MRKTGTHREREREREIEREKERKREREREREIAIVLRQNQYVLGYLLLRGARHPRVVEHTMIDCIRLMHVTTVSNQALR